VLRGEPGQQRVLFSLAGPDRLERLLSKVFDESEFLSPHGLRALSAYHREHPNVIDVEGVQASIDYEPAESTTPMFGGNSNWRGIFTDDPDGRRPCFGGTEIMQRDPAWHDNPIFSEYFHGDNGAAIGAFHQTGWTGVIADLIRRRHGEADSIGDVVRRLDAANREPREP
jgi:hypothetical protein